MRPAKPVVYLVDRPDSAQSVILVGTPQAPRNPAEDTRVSAFNALFGGNFTSRVNMNLREDKGWSYGARSSVSGGRGPRTFMIQAPVQTDQTKGALVELRKELNDIVGRKPPTPAELNTVRTNTLLGTVEPVGDVRRRDGHADGHPQLQPAGGLLGEVCRHLSDGDAGPRLRRWRKRSSPNQNHVWVIVGDRAKIEKGVRELNLGEVRIVDANGDPID